MPAIFPESSTRNGSRVRPDARDRLCGRVALLSQRCNRSKACPLRAPKDSVDDLALNQATEKGNVLRGVQQIHEPGACTQEFDRNLIGRHGRTVRRRLSDLNFLAAEKLPTTVISSLSAIARQGACSLASITLVGS